MISLLLALLLTAAPAAPATVPGLTADDYRGTQGPASSSGVFCAADACYGTGAATA